VETGKMDVRVIGTRTAVPEYAHRLTIPGFRTASSPPGRETLRPVGFAFIERRSVFAEGAAAARHWLWECPVTEIIAFVAFEIAVRCVVAWRRHFRS